MWAANCRIPTETFGNYVWPENSQWIISCNSWPAHYRKKKNPSELAWQCFGRAYYRKHLAVHRSDDTRTEIPWTKSCNELPDEHSPIINSELFWPEHCWGKFPQNNFGNGCGDTSSFLHLLLAPFYSLWWVHLHIIFALSLQLHLPLDREFLHCITLFSRSANVWCNVIFCIKNCSSIRLSAM